jgi:hypothetical protein
MSTESSRQETAVRYAAWLKERFETKGILREIAGYPNFVVWHYKEVNGQRKKPPVNPNTHQSASPTDRSTWGTLETALSAVATSKYQGIGFMLSHSPFSGIDLDHCIQEGRVEPWAQEIIETLNTYTEYSPSWNRATGTGGVHLLVDGKPPANKKAGNIEVYGEKHYLTITTKHLQGTPATINRRQEALDSLYRRIAPTVTEKPFQNTSGGCSWTATYRTATGSSTRSGAPETITRRHFRLCQPLKRGLCADYETLALDRRQHRTHQAAFSGVRFIPARQD